MARRYPQEVHDFIRENVAGRTSKELARLVNERFDLGVIDSIIAAYKKNHHLRSGTPGGLPVGHPSKQFPQEVIDYIYANYAGVGSKEMTARLNERFGKSYRLGQLRAFYHNHHLDSGLTGRFEKGHTSANKGKKGECPKGCEKTWFKKGNLPSRTKPVGYERISKDDYVQVKIKMRPSRSDCNDNFVAKHRLIWEQHYGPIPPNHVVIFKDGNKRNFDLDNLMCISRGTAAVMNRKGLFSNNPALTEAGVALAQLMRGVTGAKKKLKGNGKPNGIQQTDDGKAHQ